MSLAVIHSRTLNGVEAVEVLVEVHISGGLPSLSIVGMAETAVKESKDRVRAAIMNCGYEFPARRITINLAPADLPKQGGRFDLPIAIGILAASEQIPLSMLDDFDFVGELALGGEIRSIPGALPTAVSTAKAGRKLILPQANAAEAGLIGDCIVMPASQLQDVCRHLSGQPCLSLISSDINDFDDKICCQGRDLDEVKGQYQARRALEIAAAGSHNLLMIGPPGTGKSMLAQRLAGILPAMSIDQALEAAAVISVSKIPLDLAAWRCRRLRAPHHSASGSALVGGGTIPQPGEISLAHNGVLFLDELPQFNQHVLDMLREPIESGKISISRANRKSEFPARFQLIAAMNPCPCGYSGDEKVECKCTPVQISRYQSRVSGPFLDRIDIQIVVPRVDHAQLRSTTVVPESSSVVRLRVKRAWDIQQQRCAKPNALLSAKEVEQYCQLSEQNAVMLDQVMVRLNLSMRAYSRVLKTARTIADLDEQDSIQTLHLTEALSYREKTGRV